jgi:hypothetical protein
VRKISILVLNYTSLGQNRLPPQFFGSEVSVKSDLWSRQGECKVGVLKDVLYVWVPNLYYLHYKSCDLDCKNCDLGYKQYDPDYKNFDPYSDPDYRNLDLECMHYDYFDAPVQ